MSSLLGGALRDELLADHGPDRIHRFHGQDSVGRKRKTSMLRKAAMISISRVKESIEKGLKSDDNHLIVHPGLFGSAQLYFPSYS